MVGRCFFDGSCASGTVSPRRPSATHCFAPAGLSVSSHSWPKRFSKKPAAPLGRRARPGDLEAAGDGVAALAGAVGAVPAEALLLEGSRLRLGADVVGRTGAVRLAERVPAGDERDGLLVVHRHPAERLADVARGGQRVGVAVRALRVHVDEAHLHGAERAGRARGRRCVALVAEPGVLRTPEDLLGLPDVRRGRSRSRRS